MVDDQKKFSQIEIEAAYQVWRQKVVDRRPEGVFSHEVDNSRSAFVSAIIMAAAKQ
jgi:hypothetical protein